MTPITEARNPLLWKGVEAEQIWERWKKALDRSVTEMFRPDRARPVVELRDIAPRAESGRP